MTGRQLAHHPAWTAAGLAADLAAARDRLELMAAENLSVAAAFGLSYAGPGPTASNGCSAAWACTPAPTSTPTPPPRWMAPPCRQARRGLEALYDQHLITEPAPGRYRFHDLIREHAQTLAAADDPAARDAAATRLLDYYLHTARAAGRHFPSLDAPPKALRRPAARQLARRRSPRPGRRPAGWRPSAPTCTRPPATPPPPHGPCTPCRSPPRWPASCRPGATGIRASSCTRPRWPPPARPATGPARPTR